MMVMNSWIDSTKKARITNSQAIISTAIVRKFSKKLMKPISSAAWSSIGRAASNPALATKPGRSRSSALIEPPPAVRPRPAKERKMMSARVEKRPRISAKAPTKRIFLMKRPMTSLSPPSAQNSPASVMSIPTSTVVRKATSPPSRPKPLSIYWMNAAMKRSITLKSSISDRFPSG